MEKTTEYKFNFKGRSYRAIYDYELYLQEIYTDDDKDIDDELDNDELVWELVSKQNNL
jgi:hypothetical protein